MKKAFVYKLRPTYAQQAAMEQTLEPCRWLYNYALGECKGAWEHAARSAGICSCRSCVPPAPRTSGGAGALAMRVPGGR